MALSEEQEPDYKGYSIRVWEPPRRVTPLRSWYFSVSPNPNGGSHPHVCRLPYRTAKDARAAAKRFIDKTSARSDQ